MSFSSHSLYPLSKALTRSCTGRCHSPLARMLWPMELQVGPAHSTEQLFGDTAAVWQPCLCQQTSWDVWTTVKEWELNDDVCSKVCRELLQPLLWPVPAVLVVAPPAWEQLMVEYKTNCSLDSAGDLNFFLFAKLSGCSNAWEYTKLGWFSPGFTDSQGAAAVFHAACGKKWVGEADPAAASSRGLPTAAVFPALQPFWRLLGKRLNCWLGFQRTKSLSWRQWWWQGVYKHRSLLILK